ncbi:ECF RNA polymerase sigma factor SigE [bacterium HR37]|nr:ECF RNA polymerase sigma factor SigE [bacterium HR37]
MSPFAFKVKIYPSLCFYIIINAKGMKGLQGKTPKERIERLLVDIRENKTGAVERFLKEIQSTVLAFGIKVCGGHMEDAKDTMQEVLIQFFRGARRLRFKDPKALTVWLYKVAKNACLMSRRRGKYEPGELLSINGGLREGDGANISKQMDLPDWSGVPDRILFEKEKKQIVQRALLELPLDYRLILVLRDMEGLSTREVSEVMGISESNAKVKLHRARLYLRDKLSKHFNGLM